MIGIEQMLLQSDGTNSIHASSIMTAFGVMMTQEPSGVPFLPFVRGTMLCIQVLSPLPGKS